MRRRSCHNLFLLRNKKICWGGACRRKEIILYYACVRIIHTVRKTPKMETLLNQKRLASVLETIRREEKIDLFMEQLWPYIAHYSATIHNMSDAALTDLVRSTDIYRLTNAIKDTAMRIVVIPSMAEQQRATVCAVCMEDEGDDLRLFPTSRGCMCRVCANCFVQTIVASFTRKAYPLLCPYCSGSGGEEDGDDPMDAYAGLQHSVVNEDGGNSRFIAVPFPQVHAPTDVEGDVPNIIIRAIDPQMLLNAINACATATLEEDTRMTALSAVSLQLQSLVRYVSVGGSASSSATLCPTCRTGWGMKLHTKQNRSARCTNPSCACLYCTHCGREIDYTHIAHGCKAPSPFYTDPIPGCGNCPNCGVSSVHYYKHGCHLMHCRCGVRWCYLCRVMNATCHCPVFCDNACGCPKCPTCTADGKHCQDCKGHCLDQ
jgi:hypothetical protein